MKKKNRDNGLKIGGGVIALVLIIHWGNVFFKAKDTFKPQPKQQSQSTLKKQTKSARSNSNIITFDRCYNTSGWNSYKEASNDPEFQFRWSLEINFSEEKVTQTLIWTDATIEKNLKLYDHILNKIELDTYAILDTSSQYVKTGLGPSGKDKLLLNLKTGEVTVYHDLKKNKIFREYSNRCEIYR